MRPRFMNGRGSDTGEDLTGKYRIKNNPAVLFMKAVLEK